jgi:CMP-N-acetylneuraminic acid synthetase
MFAIIPARSGSKRIPEKNMQKVHEMTLVAHSIAHAKVLGLNPIVTSDSEEILNHATNHGAIRYKRNQVLCQDITPSWEVWDDVVKSFEIQDDSVLLQPTSIFRDLGFLHSQLNEYKISGKTSGFSAIKFRGFLYDESGTPIGRDIGLRPRTQEKGCLYIEDGAFYIQKADQIEKNKDLFGSDPYIFKSSNILIDIDEYEDLDNARRVIYT